MAERFLPTEDPVLEQVLTWTVERDARDVRRLLEWLPQARSSRERQALLDRVRDLLDELEQAMSALDERNVLHMHNPSRWQELTNERRQNPSLR